ncbi:MAG TPA: zinc ribbon domain-containing protein [Candidatus Angelobacter sp.]|jgi:hypothetical protein
MSTYCPTCGTQSGVEDAKFCKGCGGPLSGIGTASVSVPTYHAAAAIMQRTESTIVQVSPDYENARIREMEMFGWNLQGRQEIHEEGDAYGAPSISGNSYVIKTKVFHYVKLHFVRSLGLPNLEILKNLENEYFSVPFAELPGMKVPGFFTLFGILGILANLASISQPGSPGLAGVVIMLVWSALGFLWIKSRRDKRAKAQAQNQTSLARMDAIRKQVASVMPKLA